MEIARLFGVLPHTLNRLPLSEFRKLATYYRMVRARTENASGPSQSDNVVE